MAHSKSNKPTNQLIDWPVIKLAYLKGQSFRDLTERFDVSYISIYRQAKRHGWDRTDADQLYALELAQLHALADKLRDRLALQMDGAPSSAGAALGARESPATLLLKLCQITEKIITMESRLAGSNELPSSRLSEQDHEILERFKSRHGEPG